MLILSFSTSRCVGFHIQLGILLLIILCRTQIIIYFINIYIYAFFAREKKRISIIRRHIMQIIVYYVHVSWWEDMVL